MVHFRLLDKCKFCRRSHRRPFIAVAASLLFILAVADLAHAGVTAFQFGHRREWQIGRFANDCQPVCCSTKHFQSRNVIVLNEIPDSETISHTEFVDKILKPVLNEVEARGLSPHIQGIAYSCDIPTRIVFPPAPNIPSENAAWFSPIASINSATYFYQLVSAKSEHCVAVQQLLLPITGITTASTADSR